jgi:thymidylate synthase (FAD)
MSWSEVSRRYKTSRMKFWVPDEVRTAPENAKQGTGPAMEDTRKLFIAQRAFEAANEQAHDRYWTLLDLGVAPEQARAVLPQSMYVYWTWTGSLLAWLHLIRERTHHSAQTETRHWVAPIITAVAARFPATWQAVTKHADIEIPNVIKAEEEGQVLTAADIAAVESTPG